MKNLLTLPGMLVILLLTSCTTTPVIKQSPTAKIDWSQQQDVLNKMQHWAINGRIAVQTEEDGGQADYVWKQDGRANYDIRLQAPLGAGTTWITGRPTGVSIKTSSGEELFNTDVDKLMLQLNGWPLPVSGMYYWVRGLPSPGSHYEVELWNETGLPEVMFQDGWRIEFKKYKMVSGKLLPGKLFISHQGEEEVDVRLIIRQWALETGADSV